MPTAVNWPTSLPQYPLKDGLSGRQRDNVIRTPNAVGPANTRQRSTRILEEDITCSYIMTATQYTAMKTFFNTTCNGGSTSFNWPAPPAYTSTEVKFKEPFAWHKLGPDVYKITISVEEV